MSQKRRPTQAQKTIETPTKLNDSPTIPHNASIGMSQTIAPFDKPGSTPSEAEATSEAPVDSKRAKQEALKARLAALKANQN